MAGGWEGDKKTQYFLGIQTACHLEEKGPSRRREGSKKKKKTKKAGEGKFWGHNWGGLKIAGRRIGGLANAIRTRPHGYLSWGGGQSTW